MISENTLNLLPTNALAALSNGLVTKATDKQADLSAEKARSDKLNGVAEVENTEGGHTTSTLKNTLATIQSALEIGGMAKSVYDLAKTLSDGGEEPYDPQSVAPGTDTSPQAISNMGADLGDQLGSGEAQAGTSIAMGLQKLESTQNIVQMQAELAETTEQLEAVNEMIKKRATGEVPSPKVNYSKVQDALENTLEQLAQSGAFTEDQMTDLTATLERATEVNLENFEKLVEDRIVTPFLENSAAINIIASQLLATDEVEEDESIFDTVYGPPISTSGKFILSEDGLYYDSRNGSIPYVTAMKVDSRSWELRYASNRGGKGQLYTEANNQRFADTILSFEYQNESGAVKDFYEYDDILQGLGNDRNLQIQSVSGRIDDLVASGYSPSSAIVKNYKESYASIGHAYENKIKKRKKQLQIAALFGPFGVTTSSSPEGAGSFYKIQDMIREELEPLECGSEEPFERRDYTTPQDENRNPDLEITRRVFIPRIPINDFSYLKNIGLIPGVSFQEEVMLHSSDLDETTNPLPPVFLEHGPGEPIQAIPEMSIAPLGETDWVNTSGDTALAGVIPFLRTLDSSIVTDNLVVCYNFLEPSAVTAPSSNDYNVRNYVDGGYGLNAKMVGDSAASIFVSGVTIPYLTGALYDIQRKYGMRYSWLDASTGSYVRLPNNWRGNEVYPASQPLDDLMYNARGWSMDFWAHTPNLSSTLTAAHRYKLVAANENCGSPITSSPGTTTTVTAGPGGWGMRSRERTKGMIIGWRDKGDPGTVNASGLEFVVLPTVAQNDERWGKSVCIEESVSGDGGGACSEEYGFKVPVSATSVSGYTIGDASSVFTHYVIACDTPTDTMTVYVNGQFVASANISTAFGIAPGQPLNVPTQISEGAYQDPTGEFGEQLYTGNLDNKPPIFTPWILGGGFTDGVGHESPPLFSSTFPGFLGTNTNDSYFRVAMEADGGPVGQHSVLATNVPGLGGYDPTGSNYILARSGLDGHLGSFKMYGKPLSNKEVLINYNAQRPFFTGITTPFRLL